MQGRPDGEGAVGERVWCLTTHYIERAETARHIEGAADGASIEQETAAAQGCHPCLRYDLLPMSPGWTRVAEPECFLNCQVVQLGPDLAHKRIACRRLLVGRQKRPVIERAAGLHWGGGRGLIPLTTACRVDECRRGHRHGRQL